MAYTEIAAVRNALAPDGETAGTAASLGDPQVQEAIDRASSRVDTFLRRLYSVPLAEPVPEIVRDITTDVAAYDLTLAYYKSVDIQDTDPVIRRYKDARGMLGQLSTGLLTLDVDGATQTVADDPVVINPEPPRRSPAQGLEFTVVREIGPWEYRYGS